jgi:EmrB/QacA subfamily drug resistance transporter
MATGPVEPKDGLRFASPAGKWVVAATALGSGVVMLDSTVVNVALPPMAVSLDADFAGLQWVVSGYTLTLASFILVGGSLGDRFGRRRVFCIGLAWFGVASALCSVAPSIGVLTIGRILQGVGGALLTPGSLAILQASFHRDDRSRAIGAWSGLGGVTSAIGPFLGGWLAQYSWRYIFLINLPLIAFVIILTVRHVPETRDETAEGSIDVVGASVGAVGLAAATYGLIQQKVGVGLIGLVILVVFVLVEMRRRHPMLPMGIFRSRQFSASNGLTFVMYGSLGMVLFLVGLVLQIALGYSPLQAGAALLPITFIMLVFSARSGGLAQRIGPRWQMSLGPMVVAAGVLLLGRIQPGTSYFTGVFPGVVVFAAGLALTVAPLTSTVLAAADARHAGVASGVNNAVARAAGLLAVAAVPVLTGIDPTGTIGANELVSGFRTATYLAAVACVLGGLLALATITSRMPSADGADGTVGEGGEAEGPGEGEGEPCFHCSVDATPLVVDA